MKARDFLVRWFERAARTFFAPRGHRMRSPLGFLLLVFALSVPFWSIGAATEIQLLPGLPVSSLMFVCPLLAASILVYVEAKTAGVISLLKRAFDHGRIGAKAWYAPALLLMPAATVLAHALMRLTGSPLPPPQFPILTVAALSLALFVGALGEELGWSGYATDPAQEGWGALGAAVVLGSAWAAWHVVPLLQADRSPGWIAWWCLYTVAIRVLIVWVYNNAGKSVFAAALLHATGNVSWQLFPDRGSHWDPSFIAPVVVGLAAIVAFLWGPKTLARFRYGPHHG